VSEDWSAVSKAINERMTALGMRQGELVERSHVSKAIVRELQHNVVQRRRSTRTLEALSVALGWHPRTSRPSCTAASRRNPATRSTTAAKPPRPGSQPSRTGSPRSPNAWNRSTRT
jgi:hypothetical protein